MKQKIPRVSGISLYFDESGGGRAECAGPDVYRRINIPGEAPSAFSSICSHDVFGAEKSRPREPDNVSPVNRPISSWLGDAVNLIRLL